MTEDPILRELAAVAREERTLAERAVSSVAAGAPHPSPAARGSLGPASEPVSPLSPEALERITRLAAAHLAPTKRARVLSWRAFAAPLAVAAAVAVAVAWRAPSSAVTLPTYSVEVRSGASEHRAAAATSHGVAVVDDGTAAPVELVLRPEHAAALVAAYVFVERAGRVAAVEGVVVERSSEGAVRVRGPAAIAAGATALRVVIVASKSQIGASEALALAQPGAALPLAVRVVVVPVVAVAPPR